jgi:enamine deaminase RidA (YjgF/YER057c/UK114 family)
VKKDDTPSGKTETAGNRAGPDFCFTVNPVSGEGINELFSRLATMLVDKTSTIASLTIFGAVTARTAADEAMRRVLGPANWPVTWAEGLSADGRPISGIQAFACRAGSAHPLTLNGRVVGSVIDDAGARHCLLGGLEPDKLSKSPVDQLKQTLETLEKALEQAGFSLSDVIRTWFYVDEILSWYDEFNEARTKAYAKVKFRGGSSPTSTAVSARNPAGAALVASAWALKPRDKSAEVTEIPSPMQCPAVDYGSSFSRAVEISSPLEKRLLISGTASIAPDGQTAWPGDVRRQIDLTMDVVESILTSRHFGLSDVTRATAYFKNRADIPHMAAWCARRGLQSLPVAAVQCGICRDDLLFELEADAFRRFAGSTPGSQ